MSTTQTLTAATPLVQEGSETVTDTNKANITTTTTTETRFQKTAHGGLIAPPIILPAIQLLLLYKRQIPYWDCFFSIAFPVYLCLANRFRFDSNARQIAIRKSKGESYPAKPQYGEGINKEPFFLKHMMFAAILGIFLPLATQVLAPPQIAQAAAPHLYMLVWQVMMEIMSNGPEFHPLLQLMVPLGFSTYRMSSLKSWVVLALEISDSGASTTTNIWATVHLVLAVSNAIFWTCNTFIMLSLRIVPHCLDQELFPDAANVTWNYMIPSVSNENDLGKDKVRVD